MDDANQINLSTIHGFTSRVANLLQPQNVLLIFTIKASNEMRHLYYVRFFSISRRALGSVIVVHLGRHISDMRWSLRPYSFQKMFLYRASSFVKGVLCPCDLLRVSLNNTSSTFSSAYFFTSSTQFVPTASLIPSFCLHNTSTGRYPSNASRTILFSISVILSVWFMVIHKSIKFLSRNGTMRSSPCAPAHLSALNPSN